MKIIFHLYLIIETAQTKARSYIEKLAKGDAFESSLLKEYNPHTEVDVWNFLTKESARERCAELTMVLNREHIPNPM